MTTATTATTSRRRQHPVVIATLYGGLLVTAFLAFASHEWGATPHSLVSIAALAAVAWHVWTQRRWLHGVVERGRRHPQRALVVSNALLISCFVLVNVSGAPVWLWNVDGPVSVVHDITGFAILPLLVAHLVLNRRRIRTLLRRRRAHPQPSAHGSATGTARVA